MIYFLIPSYNDSGNFDTLLKNISKTVKKQKKIIIVDDGSTDETKKVITKLAKIAPLLRVGYKNNRGPGFAFKSGFDFLKKEIKRGDLIVTMEADNTSDYSILNKMLNLAKKYDVVLSSPYSKGGKFLGISQERKILSLVSNYLDQIIFGLSVKTTSSFYRVYKAEILKKAFEKYNDRLITDDGFSAVIEILIKLKKINAKFIEVPAIVDWTKRDGKSKMKVLKTVLRHMNLYKDFYEGKFNK